MVLKIFTLIAVLVAVPVRAQDSPIAPTPTHVIVDSCLGLGCGGVATGPGIDILSVAGTVILPGGSVPVVFGGSLPTGANTIGAINLAQYTPNVGRLPVLADINGPVAVTGTFFQPTQPISAASLPLPTGASTGAKQDTQQAALDAIKTAVELIDNCISGARCLVTEDSAAALLSRANLLLADATFTGRINTLGQKTSATSTPVVLASDALPPPDRAATGSITALFGSATILSQGAGTVTITLGGTWVGTLSFFGLDGGGQIVAIYGVNLVTGLADSTATANGAWLLPSAGWSSVGAIATAWTSGTVTTAMIAGPGSNAVTLARSLPAGVNTIGGLLSNVAPGTTAPTHVDVMGGKTNDPTPQYQPLPLAAGGIAVQVAVLGAGSGLPKPPCNAVRRTNCSPKGF